MWRWRLEISVRAYVELDTANPMRGRTAAKYPSGAWSANCVIRDRVTEKRGREGRMKRKGAVWSIVGVTNL